MEEVWKDIPNYENLYQVSNFGNVKSLDRKVKQWNRFKNIYVLYKGKLIKPNKTNKGYLKVGLSKEGKTKYYNIQRLVAMAFLENFDSNLTVDHINCDKTQNNVDNLQMLTLKENIQLSYKNKLHKLKKVAKYDLKDNLLKIYDSVAEASRLNGCSSQLIKNCCDNKKYCKTGKGFKWKYVEGDE